MEHCIVHYLAEAVVDFDHIRDRSERRAILTVVDKLSRIGDKLTMPHARHLSGRTSGLYELRPKSGRSRYRPLYVKVGEVTFAILAVAPESVVDPRGFERAVDRAILLARESCDIRI